MDSGGKRPKLSKKRKTEETRGGHSKSCLERGLRDCCEEAHKEVSGWDILYVTSEYSVWPVNTCLHMLVHTSCTVRGEEA